MSEIDYAARVQRGAALLDEKWPTWAQDIDLDTLDVGDGERCVTAQFYLSTSQENEYDENWTFGRRALGLNDKEYADHGFNGTEWMEGNSVPESTFATLNRLWRDLIIQRREAAQPPEASER